MSALLAIWATGAACVPLGTCDPPRRVAARLAETGVALLLCDRGAESNALPVPVVRLDDTIEADTASIARPIPTRSPSWVLLRIATARG